MTNTAAQGAAPAPSHGDLWRIAAPLILSNISVPLLGLVDSAVLGHLPGPAPLGAVAVGSSIFAVLFMALNFLRMGTTGLTAQAVGRQDTAAVSEILAQGLWLAWALAAALLILQWPLQQSALYLMAPQGEILELAAAYFQIRIWGAPFALSQFVLIGWMVGRGDVKSPLIMLLVTNGINIVLDVWFVLGLGWGAEGVALGTVLAEACGVIVGLWRCPAPSQGWVALLSEALAKRAGFLRLLTLNRDIFIRSLFLVGSLAFFTRQGAAQGEAVLAANALLLQLHLLASYGLDGLAHAAEVYAGRAWGAGLREPFRQAVRRSVIWSFLVAAVFSLLYALAGQHVLALLSDIPAVLATAVHYLPWLAALPLVAVAAFVYDGVMVGATLSRQMRNNMLVSVLLVYLPVWWMTQDLGNHGLWLAFLLWSAARGISGWWTCRQHSRRLR